MIKGHRDTVLMKYNLNFLFVVELDTTLHFIDK